MYPFREAKTAFITPYGMYCYNVMLFGLKNARATYQRMMSRVFEPLLGKTMEVYIDDIMVKSKLQRYLRPSMRGILFDATTSTLA